MDPIKLVVQANAKTGTLEVVDQDGRILDGVRGIGIETDPESTVTMLLKVRITPGAETLGKLVMALS